MSSFWEHITSALSALKDFLVAYGPFGLFSIALLDSALVPLPGGVDVVMIVLSKGQPALMLLCAAGATLGSVIGCVILYYISRKAGRRALARFSEQKQARVKQLIDRYDVLSVLAASVLPPPFPFKLFVISCGVFRLSLARFIIAIAVGRGFRFFLEGYLAVHFGEQAEGLFKQYFPWIGLGFAILIIIFLVVRVLLRRRATVKEQGLDPSS